MRGEELAFDWFNCAEISVVLVRNRRRSDACWRPIGHQQTYDHGEHVVRRNRDAPRALANPPLPAEEESPQPVRVRRERVDGVDRRREEDRAKHAEKGPPANRRVGWATGPRGLKSQPAVLEAVLVPRERGEEELATHV